MRLLLLLSAFLTAMVGVGTPAAAAPRPACAVSTMAGAGAERQAPEIAAFAQGAPRLLDSVNFASVVPALAPLRMVPLYAGRLRV